MMEKSPRARSDRGSVPLALLVGIIAAGLMTVVVASVLTGQRAVRFDRSFTDALHVAETGLEEVVFMLNNGLLVEGDSPASGSGVANGSEYEWTAEHVGEEGWTVISTANTDVMRTVMADVAERPRFHLAAFSDRDLVFRGANNADSYNSSSGVWCTGNGRVGSNDAMDFQGQGQGQSTCHSGARTVDGVDLYDWDDNPGAPDDPSNPRCTHAAGTPNNCRDGAGNPQFLSHPDRLPIADENQVQFMYDALTACEADGGITDVWRTSVHGPELAPSTSGPRLDPNDPSSPRYRCVKQLIFDEDTKLAANASRQNPVVIFVEEYVQVAPSQGGGGGQGAGVVVNCFKQDGETRCQAGQETPDAGALQIYSPATGGPAGSDAVRISQQSTFAGAVYAPRASCGGVQGANAGVHIYGSLVCGDIRNVGGWQFHFDDALVSITTGEFSIARWLEQAVSAQ